MMGFTKVANHRSKSASLYRQGEINLILNSEPSRWTSPLYQIDRFGEGNFKALFESIDRDRCAPAAMRSTVMGEPIAIGEASNHVAGFCLLNDWSARDVQTCCFQEIIEQRRADLDSGPMRCISRHVPQRAGASGCGKPDAGIHGEAVTTLFDSQGPVGKILQAIITMKMPWAEG